MPFRGQMAPAGSGGGGGATNSTFVATGFDPVPLHLAEFETDVTTLGGNTADGSGLVSTFNDSVCGLFVVQIAFDALYGGAGIRLTGLDRFKASQTEDITASAGNTVKAAKAFSSLTNIATLTPGGDNAKLARLQFRRVCVVGHAPVAQFAAVYNGFTGGVLPVATEDKTNGWVELTGGLLPAAGTSLSVAYSWSHTHTIS
jgi:hypothetical protein